MERSGSTLWLTLIFLLLPGLSVALPPENQPGEPLLDTIRHQLKVSYLHSRMDQWPPLIDQLKNERANNDFATTFIFCQAQYGYIGYLLSKKKKREAGQRLEETMSILDQTIGQFPDSAQLYAMRAGLIGYEIGVKPLKAPWLGPRNQDNIEQALTLNPREPRA